MTRLRADFLYSVSNLWIARDVEATSRRLEVDGFDIEIRIPTDIEVGDRLGKYTSVRSGSSSGTPEDPQQYIGIDAIQLLVDSDGDVSVEALKQEGRAASDRGFEFLRRAQDLADRVVSELVDWMRIRGQARLGLHGQRAQFTGIQSLYDLDAGERLPLGWPGISSVVEALDPARALDSAVFDQVTKDIAERTPLPIAETFLADAKFLIRAPDSDPVHAVLAAAIGAEVKVKGTLRRVATPQQVALLDLLLENPRDFSVAAVSLFDKALDAAVGRSLRTEDARLYKRVQRLYELRNAIAHRAERPSLEAARDVVLAAEAAFRFLDSVPRAD